MNRNNYKMSSVYIYMLLSILGIIVVFMISKDVYAYTGVSEIELNTPVNGSLANADDSMRYNFITGFVTDITISIESTSDTIPDEWEVYLFSEGLWLKKTTFQGTTFKSDTIATTNDNLSIYIAGKGNFNNVSYTLTVSSVNKYFQDETDNIVGGRGYKLLVPNADTYIKVPRDCMINISCPVPFSVNGVDIEGQSYMKEMKKGQGIEIVAYTSDEYSSNELWDWIKLEYYISPKCTIYNMQDGTPKEIAYYYVGQTKPNLPTQIDCEKGYELDSWYEDKEYTKPVSNIRNSAMKNWYLFPKLKCKKYKITYQLNDATNNDSNPSEYTIEDGLISLKPPTYDYWVFVGWVYYAVDVAGNIVDLTGIQMPTNVIDSQLCYDIVVSPKWDYAQLNEQKITLEADCMIFEDDSQFQKPKVYVNGKKANGNGNFEIEYESCRYPGIAKVTVTAIDGEYEGSATLKYSIKMPDIAKISAKTSGNGKLRVNACYKGSATGFNLRYRIKGKKKWKQIKVNTEYDGNAYSHYKSLSNLINGKKYQVQARTYYKRSKKKIYYGKWSAVKAVKVK